MIKAIEKLGLLNQRHSVSIQGGIKGLKNLIVANRGFLLSILLCFFLILFHSLGAGHFVNFYPINGTFQNFNPVRRLLGGQIPYRDFQDYLGMGHLYIGSISTFLFGGTYRSSLMAFSFLTLSSFAGISYVIGKVVLEKKNLLLLAQIL
jgi:hypothetical protein